MHTSEFKTRFISVGFSRFFLLSLSFSYSQSLLSLFLLFFSLNFEFHFVLFTNKLHAIHNVHFDCRSTVVAFVRFARVSCVFCLPRLGIHFGVFIVDFNWNVYVRYMRIYMGVEYGNVCVESFGWPVIYGCTTNISLHSFRVAFDYSLFVRNSIELHIVAAVCVCWPILFYEIWIACTLQAQLKKYEMNTEKERMKRTKEKKKVKQRFKCRSSEQMSWIDSTNGAHSFTHFDYCNLTFGFGSAKPCSAASI